MLETEWKKLRENIKHSLYDFMVALFMCIIHKKTAEALNMHIYRQHILYEKKIES